MRQSHLGGVIPGQQIIDLALLVSVDNGLERGGQIGVRLDGVEFAGLDQGGDGRPVCGTGIVSCKEGVFSVQGDGPDRSLDGVVVHLDPAIGEEEAKANPVFRDVFQRLAQRGFGGYAGAVVGEPSLEGGDLRRGLVLADGQASFRRQTADLGFDLVELGDALQPVLGDGAVLLRATSKSLRRAWAQQ